MQSYQKLTRQFGGTSHLVAHQMTLKNMKTMKTKNPFKERIDLTTQLRFPVLSWSSFYSFTEWDKNEWYDRYYLGKKGDINSLMQGGIDVGERITQDKKFLPKLPRPEIFEKNFEYIYKWKETLDDEGHYKTYKTKLVGHLDGYSPKVPGIDEYKTSINPKRWTQKEVDGWRQLTWYCMLVWMIEGIKPEEIKLRLMYIPMESCGDFSVNQKGEIVIFNTKRRTLDVLNLMVDIKRVFKEMEAFIHSKELTLSK
jgi:hypothetical protein